MKSKSSDVPLRKRIAWAALAATGLAAVVVMLGAWTRLVDAGLGCPDWPGCYGFIGVPMTAQDIAIAEARFPEAPVEVDKGWPEMIHRYFATSLGFVILCLSVYTFWSSRRSVAAQPKSSAQPSVLNGIPKLHIAGLLVLVICQGLFGMWTVTLKLWPQVVSIHLLGGFATLSLLFLLFLRTRAHEPLSFDIGSSALAHMKRLAVLALILTVIQIFLGAWTASNYAALACGDELPTCQGAYWPEMNFTQGFDLFQSIGPNYLGGLLDNESRVAIQVSHRIGALLLTAYFIYMFFSLKKLLNHQVLKQAVLAVFIVLVVQIALGLSNVIWLIPLSIAVAHNAVGALLLLSLVNLNYQLSRIKQK
jgi:cytochrome c oxidase assembly protein subunit 15